MAKLTAPLLSLGARGTIGKTMTFASWKGRPYVRQRVDPANPNSTEQQTTRSLFRSSFQVYRQGGTLFRAPWDLFVTGQVLTSWNAFQGRYTRDLRDELTFALLTFSPGARGGIAPVSVAAAGGVGAGEIDVTIVAPTPPTGWAVDAFIAVAIEDGDPADPPSLAVFEAEAPASPVTLTGLESAATYQVGGYIRWTKDDGSIAYGPSLNDTAAAT